MNHHDWKVGTVNAMGLQISKSKVFGFDVLYGYGHVYFITDVYTDVSLGVGQISGGETSIVCSRALYEKTFRYGNSRSKRHVGGTGIVKIVSQNIVPVPKT